MSSEYQREAHGWGINLAMLASRSPIGGWILAGLALVLSMIIFLAMAADQESTSLASSGSLFGGPPSAQASKLIPPDMLALYQSDIVKEQCPGLSWTVVAAIIHVESDDNRNPGTSSAGAMGASQFMPATWDSQGRLSVDVGKPYGKDPHGYAMDGDGDGIADIMDPRDSVPATARMLCANGGGNPQTLPQAIYDYNHAWWYVYGGTDDNGNPFVGVLPLAAQLSDNSALLSSATASTPQDPRVMIAIQAAATQLGEPYVWGGGGINGPSTGQSGGVDPYQATHTVGFDCSGLMQWAFAKAGILLPRSAAEQYTVGVHVSRNQLQPGDMVFWASDPSNPSTIHHVALYIGNNAIIAAPHTGAVVQIESMYWLGFIGGTRV